MDPGVRRDDDLRVCSQPSLPLFQPTVKTENPFACRSVILTKVRIQRLSSFLSATKGRYKGTLTLFTPSGKCNLSTPIRQSYTTMDPGLRRDDDLRVCS